MFILSGVEVSSVAGLLSADVGIPADSAGTANLLGAAVSLTSVLSFTDNADMFCSSADTKDSKLNPPLDWSLGATACTLVGSTVAVRVKLAADAGLLVSPNFLYKTTK